MGMSIGRTVGGSLAVLGTAVVLAACSIGPVPVSAPINAPISAPQAATTAPPTTSDTGRTSTPTTVTSVRTVLAAPNSSGSAVIYVEQMDSNGPETKPNEFNFYEHTSMDGIVWSSWGGPSAQGDGELSDDDCNPDCADGHDDKYDAHIVLSDIQTVNGQQEYTRYTVTFNGQDQNPELADELTNQPTKPS
jgi:hypothetical protein